MMNCIIVDDDAVALLDVKNKVEQVAFLNLVGTYSSAAEASKVILSQQVDLMILDIMMPEINGFELIQSLKNSLPLIVLMSSSKDFAIEAFDFDVTDYLIKPILNERFFKAMAKARKIHESRSGISSHTDDHLFVKVNTRLVKINISDILYVEALADYVILHTASGKYTIHSTMKNIERSLSDRNFYRAHNSYIICLDKISEIEDNCVVIGDKLIPVSRSKIKGLLDKVKLLT